MTHSDAKTCHFPSLQSRFFFAHNARKKTAGQARCFSDPAVTASLLFAALKLFAAVQVIEHLLNGRRILSELFDGQVVGLIVSKAQVVLGGLERLLDLLEMIDRLVDLFDRSLELLGS